MLENNLYKENYYALLACIFNKKLSSDKAIRTIVDPKIKKQKKPLKGMEVTNLTTGKVKKYYSARAAAEEIGIAPGTISTYALRKYTYKNIYKFRYLAK